MGSGLEQSCIKVCKCAHGSRPLHCTSLLARATGPPFRTGAKMIRPSRPRSPARPLRLSIAGFGGFFSLGPAISRYTCLGIPCWHNCFYRHSGHLLCLCSFKTLATAATRSTEPTYPVPGVVRYLPRITVQPNQKNFVKQAAPPACIFSARYRTWCAASRPRRSCR
jgi:hypothetical protein